MNGRNVRETSGSRRGGLKWKNGLKDRGASKQRNREHDCVSLVFLGSKLKILKMCKGLLSVVVQACKMWPEGLGVW